MKTKSVILSVALSMVCLAASNAEACTTTIVTKGERNLLFYLLR